LLKEEISCEKLTLRVWKNVSDMRVVEEDVKDEGGGTSNEGKQEASIKDGGGEGEGSGEVLE